MTLERLKFRLVNVVNLLKYNILHKGGKDGAEFWRKNVPDLIRKEFQDFEVQQVFASCPVGLALLDSEGNISLNQVARELLNQRVSRQETVCTRWIAGAATRLRASGRQQESLPGIRDHQLGLEVRVSGNFDSTGQVMAILAANPPEGTSGDLAETVSTLSHELRTPLTSMKSSLSLVLSGETGNLNEDQKHFLGMTMRNIDRLDRLVGDLLDVSQADAGLLNLRPQQLDAAEVVRDTLETHRQAAVSAGLELAYQGPQNTLNQFLDRDKLVQMVTNLLGNAIKYTPAGGKVKVVLEVTGDQDTLRIEVRDNGPGMDRLTSERAMQPFHRSETAAKSLVPGAGLGLHITKRLAEAHGGRLGLESKLGLGTLVWIELPLTQGPGQFQAPGQVGLTNEPMGI